jgi:two-component system NtrC family sensor kinase
MKNGVAFGFLMMLLWSVCFSQQQQQIDSLKHELEISRNDTLRLVHFLLLGEVFGEANPDSSLYYAKKELTLASKLKLRLNEAFALNHMAYALKNMGNYPTSLQTYLAAKMILEDASVEETILPDINTRLEGFIKKPVTPRMMRLQELGFTHFGLALLYETANNYDKALVHAQLARKHFEEIGNIHNSCLIHMILGRLYLFINKKDSALFFEQKAYDLAIQYTHAGNLAGIFMNLGRIHLAMDNKPLAAEYFRKAVAQSVRHGYYRGQVAANLLLFDVYQQEGRKDSSLYFANEALKVSEPLNSPDLLLRVYTTLAAFYSSSGRNDSTVKYQSLVISLKDSLFNSKQVQQFQNIDFDEQQRKQEIEAAKKAYRAQVQVLSLLIGLFTLLLVAIILWRNNRQKQRAYLLLENQKQETESQKAKVEQTLEELKSAQSQLIQSEKMASLGELTAGIAHEIQNPLNFVNNFSEVNQELLSEMKEEIKKGNLEEATSLAGNVIDNQEKINQHGKRADAIVKSMLQHSRSSSGIKEPTNINTLVDEYLRLAYHGLRAKDKSFNVTLKTNFDADVGVINIVPQDVGRVILNLLNNAFYAINEKSTFAEATADKIYEPTVSVSTKNSDNAVLISIKDNGNGIPQKVLDKIFQPFFTTKPTGQGTGLGLSLSYDIVKAHGGELHAKTNEGNGSEFIIMLPAT